MSPSFFSAEDPRSMYLGGRLVKDLMAEHNLVLNDFSAYIPPRPDEIELDDIKVSFLGYFEKWDPQECFYYAAQHTGFSAAPQRSPGTYSKYTEIDDKIVAFHFYMTYIKFGIGRASYDAAQEIRNNKIDREEGVALVQKYDGEFPQQYFQEFIDYIGISQDDFYKYVDQFRSPHLWRKIGGTWSLRHNVSGSGVDD